MQSVISSTKDKSIASALKYKSNNGKITFSNRKVNALWNRYQKNIVQNGKPSRADFQNIARTVKMWNNASKSAKDVKKVVKASAKVRNRKV